MSRRLAATLALALVLPAAVAFADLSGQQAPPQFTPEEIQIIARNASLKAIIEEDPWLVRRFLDAMQAQAGGQAAPPASAGDSDPDLNRFKRASPEASHDLFQILKQAGRPK